MLSILIIIVCVYLCVRVSAMQKQLNRQQELIDELISKSDHSVPEELSVAEHGSGGMAFQGHYIGPDLKATLCELKRKGNMDAAIFEFCKSTGLSEEKAREYLTML